MRDELRHLLLKRNYWVYGVSEREFDYTIDLVRGFHRAADMVTKQACEQIGDKIDEETKEEIISDLAHYNWADKAYLWAFAIWRMQGVIEAMILSNFLPVSRPKRLIGLKSKLDAMKSTGYRIAPTDEADLMLWGDLRNLFSHMPPEEYRPIPLEERDVQEYKDLLIKICAEWHVQSKSITRTAH